jgi:hypothetical protein
VQPPLREKKKQTNLVSFQKGKTQPGRIQPSAGHGPGQVGRMMRHKKCTLSSWIIVCQNRVSSTTGLPHISIYVSKHATNTNERNSIVLKANKSLLSVLN